jgi:CRISPR/Cas system-associated protein Cas10 (large subunit of type III CRISPR-Cas system)
VSHIIQFCVRYKQEPEPEEAEQQQQQQDEKEEQEAQQAITRADVDNMTVIELKAALRDLMR